MSCICQECGKKYNVDLNIPDAIWEKIKPAHKLKGSGLLCGGCIMNKIESFKKYGIVDVHSILFAVNTQKED